MNTVTKLQSFENKPRNKNSMGLEEFLLMWDAAYLESIKTIPLFDNKKNNSLDRKQIEYFVKTFYHARGHFHDVLWYMGNFSPDMPSKKIILDNIADEFGGKGLSHERLYLLFAESFGIDLSKEFISQESYLPCLQDFNRGHLEWLAAHDWEERMAFFAALERLDNVDYRYGKNIAESFGSTGSALTFFNAHINSNHFNPIYSTQLTEIWNSAPQKVEKGFDFVRMHQIKMWNNLSDAVFNYTN